MKHLALGILFLACSAPGRTAPAAAPCPPQPLPAALDSVQAPDAARTSIAFSAAPSREYPGRAWVVRAHEARGEAGVEILRLRRRSDCNLYDVEARWQAPMPAAEYRALLRRVGRAAIPPAGYFTDEDSSDGLDIVADGTGTELRLKRGGWEVRRKLNHYEPGGAAVSAIFDALVEKHVPADERPAEDWRSRRRS